MNAAIVDLPSPEPLYTTTMATGDPERQLNALRGSIGFHLLHRLSSCAQCWPICKTEWMKLFDQRSGLVIASQFASPSWEFQ